MGPLLMTGLSCFGAAVAVGWIAMGTWPSDGARTNRRVLTGPSLAIILMALCLGIAILGTVVGLLAIFVAGAVSDSSYGLLAAGPAVAGGLVGLVLIVRHWGLGDRGTLVRAGAYILGIASLGIVVALLGLFIVDVPTRALTNWPFAILGLITGACALVIGATGASAVRAMRGVDEQTAKAIAAAQISRIGLIQAVSIGANVAAIALIVLS